VQPQGISTELNIIQSGTVQPWGTGHPGPVVCVTTGQDTTGPDVMHGAKIVVPAHLGHVPHAAVWVVVGMGEAHMHG
jgi:hypothetical protein